MVITVVDVCLCTVALLLLSSLALGAVQISSLTGNILYQVQSVGDQNTWVLTPSNPAASKVLIIFTAMSMRQAEVRVYDTASINEGSILFNCASCGSTLPPPFYSTTGSVTIVCTAVNGVGFLPSSFALQFVAVPVVETTLLSNTYVTLNMGTAPIRPFTFNNFLPSSSNQQWAINTGSQIVLSFSKFSFPSDCTAEVQIHNRLTGTSNSSLIFRGCRNTDAPSAWLYSSTGVALVIVKTTSRSAVDFQLNYFSDTDMYRCGSIDQPALLADRSMILADGSTSTGLMQRGVSCTWLISPAIGSPVSLVMNRVSMKFGSSIAVYDGSSDRGTLLWNAVGASLTIPPIITSTTSSLFVRYQSDSSNAIRYFGFQGDYAANYLGSGGSGKGYTQLGMSSVLEITPPGDGYAYTAGARYIWYVAPVGASGPITFAVSALRLRQPGSKVTILEGVTGNTGGDMGGVAQSYDIGSRRVLATLTGSEVPTDWVRTTGTAATVIFEGSSEPAATAAGDNFQLAYYSDGPNYHCGFTTNPAQLTMPSFILTDGSASAERAYPNQLCRWVIAPTNASSVMLVFDRFHLYGGYLRIYTGRGFSSGNLYVEIGETYAVPAPILLSGGVVSLEYATEATVSGFGFSLTFYGVTSSRSFPGDRVVTLTSASVLSLALPTNQLAANTSLKWIVAPSSSTGKIYLALSSVTLPSDCSRAYLDVYDGIDETAPLLGRFCGDTLPSPYQWLQTSASVAMLSFHSDTAQDSEGNFELSYHTDGPNFHCGFAVNPARVTAASMVFTDGSGTEEALFPNQHCEWVIAPTSPTGSTAATEDTRIVLELSECDLAGATLRIYDGDSVKAPLLWACAGCINLPGPIISSSNKVYVKYTSEEVGEVKKDKTFGSGFRLLYWTASATTLRRSSDVLAPRLLERPTALNMTNSPVNTSAAFFLGTSTTHSSLRFYPFYTAKRTTDITAHVADGRTAPSVFESPTTIRPVCGVVSSATPTMLMDSTIAYAATQALDGRLSSSTALKEIVALTGADLRNEGAYGKQESESYLSVSRMCKYRVDSGSLQAVAINIENFRPQRDGHLIVYGGLSSDDAIMFDSNYPEKYLRAPSRYVSTVARGVWTQSVNLTAPCGQATIILQPNITKDFEDTEPSMAVMVDYSLHIVYYALTQDSGQECSAYFRSLQPPPAKEDHTVVVLIACGSFAGCCLVFAIFYYAGQIKAQQGYYFYPYGLRVTQKKIIKATPAHPRYSGKWDQYLNRFLRKGECCVCKGTTQVVMRLKCGHGLCLEDIKGYLESALGDISMFPVKCPMHYQGCEGQLDARVAKRVLTEPQYNRFNEFSDRALYGDGMRCIFCQNYVNFPESMEHVARVVCPYCQQNFCVRCKKAWHNGNRCAVDLYDPSLEVWKNSSGAQKCPACKKLIEKDDPDTCNHMVHKITDGIPCIRERTDFCYCCGEEVTSDYPHEEVAAKGVNHFPDGVFQRCRRIVMKEKEAERERLRKARRMKTKIQPINRPSGALAGSFSAGSSALPLDGAPPGGSAALESMWLLEQQYDIESPVSSPSRPIPRSGGITPLMTPSPGRVHPGVEGGDGLDSPATASTVSRPSPSGSARLTPNNRVAPSGIYTTTIPNGIAAAARSSAGSPVRPFPTLEQQMLFQQSAMLATRGSGNALHGSASSPQLLLGSPLQQQRTRFASPARPTIV